MSSNTIINVICVHKVETTADVLIC